MARFVHIADKMVDVDRVVAFQFVPAGREGKWCVDLTFDTPPHEVKNGASSVSQWPVMKLGPFDFDAMPAIVRAIVPAGQDVQAL